MFLFRLTPFALFLLFSNLLHAEKPIPFAEKRELPQLIERSEPEYTQEGRDAKIEGVCVLTMVVNKEGKAEQIRVAQSLDTGLDQKAIEALSRWRFIPGKKGGEPIDTPASVEINFRLP